MAGDIRVGDPPSTRRSARIAALKDASATRVSLKSVVGVCMYLHLDPGLVSMVSLEEAEKSLGNKRDVFEQDLHEYGRDAYFAGGVFMATRLNHKRYMRPRDFDLSRPPVSQWEAYQCEDKDVWVEAEKREVAKGRCRSSGSVVFPLDGKPFLSILFTMPVSGKPLKLILCVHVDDVIGVTNSAPLWKWWIVEMGKHMEIKDLGPVEMYLGMRIIRDRPGRKLWISMANYINQILHDEGMSTCTPFSLPIAKQLWKLKEPEKSAMNGIKDEDIKAKYQKMNGCVNWAAVTGRPDLSYSAMAHGQYAADPK